MARQGLPNNLMPWLARRAGDIAACYAAPVKAARLLGWRATRTLQDRCRDTWHWQIRGARHEQLEQSGSVPNSLAEKVEAFVSRFGRLQDHLGEKLIPRFAALVGESPKSMLDVLAYAEKNTLDRQCRVVHRVQKTAQLAGPRAHGRSVALPASAKGSARGRRQAFFRRQRPGG